MQSEGYLRDDLVVSLVAIGDSLSLDRGSLDHLSIGGVLLGGTLLDIFLGLL